MSSQYIDYIIFVLFIYSLTVNKNINNIQKNIYIELLILELLNRAKVSFMMKTLDCPNRYQGTDGTKLLTASTNEYNLYGGARAGISLPTTDIVHEVTNNVEINSIESFFSCRFFKQLLSSFS